MARPSASSRRVAEHLLRRGIEFDDQALAVDRDDAVEGRIEHRAGARIALRRSVGVVLLRPGDVEDVALHAERPAGRVAHQRALVAHPGHTAVAPQQPVLALQPLAGLDHVRRLRDHALAIVRVEDADEEVGVRGPVLGRVAEQLRRLRAHVETRRDRVGRVDVDDQRQALEQVAVVRPVGQGGTLDPFSGLHGFLVRIHALSSVAGGRGNSRNSTRAP